MSRAGIRHPVKGAVGAPGVSTMRIRARLRVSEPDSAVVVAMGEHFDRLCGRDLAARLSTRDHKVCGPSAAAAVLGRRALGHPARRRAQASPGVTTPDQRIEAAGQPAGVENYRLQNADGQQTECQGTFSSDSRTPAAQR